MSTVPTVVAFVVFISLQTNALVQGISSTGDPDQPFVEKVRYSSLGKLERLIQGLDNYLLYLLEPMREAEHFNDG